MDIHHERLIHLIYGLTKIIAIPIQRIGIDPAKLYPCIKRLPDHLDGQFYFSFFHYGRFGDPRLGATQRVFCPLIGQKKAGVDNAHPVVAAQGSIYARLAVFYLSQVAVVLGGLPPPNVCLIYRWNFRQHCTIVSAGPLTGHWYPGLSFALRPGPTRASH